MLGICLEDVETTKFFYLFYNFELYIEVRKSSFGG